MKKKMTQKEFNKLPEKHDADEIQEKIVSMLEKYGGSVVFKYISKDVTSDRMQGCRTILRGVIEEYRDDLMRARKDDLNK